MAATDAGAHKLERYEDRVDRALASRIGSSDADAKREQAGVEDNDLAALRGSVRLGPHPSEQAREEFADDEPYYPQAGDSEDEAMGETLTIGEIKHRMRIQSLRGPHPCDSRVPLRPKSADEGEEDEVTAVLAVLGADPSSFRREKKQAVRRLVSEKFSPPRVTAMLKRMTNHGPTPGLALDLTTIDPEDGMPWDFDVPATRDKALRLQRGQKPLFIIGSPMCTRWCSWQHINDKRRDPEIVKREKKQALVHLEFMT